MPNSSIKNEKMYQDLRKQGDSKEKAARISNAAAGRGNPWLRVRAARLAPTPTGRCRN